MADQTYSFLPFPVSLSNGELSLRQAVQHKIQQNDDHQNAEGHGTCHRLAGKRPVFIELEADGFGGAGIEQSGHGELIEAGDEDKKPACGNGRKNQPAGDAEHGPQPGGAGNLGALLQ